MNVVNSGSMAAAPQQDCAIGHLTFNRSLTGFGTVSVGKGDVTVNGAVGAGQAFLFRDWAPSPQSPPTGATPTLYLNDLKDFAGDIGLFDQGGYANCRIVVDTSDWTFKSVASNTFDSWLVFSNGAAETRVHLEDMSAFYDPALFHASVAGHTTTITYG